MKYIIGLLAMLLPILSAAQIQQKNIEPFYIGDRIPDLPLKGIINFKDSTATLSSFGDKLLILDFWNIHCTSCIQIFPLEDSLQGMFPEDVQFILVTNDSRQKVEQFFQKYNAVQKKQLGLPVIIEDRLLSSLFRFRYIPHYVWIAPNGLIIAESSDYFITKENIANTLKPIRAEEARLKGNKYADFNLHIQKPDKEFLQLISSLND